MQPTIRLLYAEGDNFDADLTKFHLSASVPSIQVEVVSTGGQCLKELSEKEYDLLLLDNRLPDIDGIDVLHSLMAKDYRLPIVMVTEFGDEELVVRAMRAGAWDYIPKISGYLSNLPTIIAQAITDFGKHEAKGRAIAARKQKVLYVEDDDGDLEEVLEHFRKEAPHFDIEHIGQANLALEQLQRKHDYDVVLTELRTSDIDVFKSIQKAKFAEIGVPFVVITSQGDEAKAMVSLRSPDISGISRYVRNLPSSKPHDSLPSVMP